MSETIQALYACAAEKNFFPYLEDPEYRAHCRAEEKAMEELSKRLSPEDQKRLQELWTYRVLRCSAETEAAFQAGLSMGLELSRL